MASKTKTKSEVELLNEISTKMDYLIGLYACNGKERDEQIKILTSQGLANSTIAVLLGIPKGTVDSVRAKMKK
jgi:FixJ family two-component response regulator